MTSEHCIPNLFLICLFILLLSQILTAQKSVSSEKVVLVFSFVPVNDEQKTHNRFYVGGSIQYVSTPNKQFGFCIVTFEVSKQEGQVGRN